ncbi:hypothetical protein PRJ_5691 (plasmid) [Pseudomonas sp. XWY-1]|nr:hypothetical protein PRJ_5691 [Pseudomonas sp. XWY-1]
MGMRHAADFGHALLEAGLVAGKVTPSESASGCSYTPQLLP